MKKQSFHTTLWNASESSNICYTPNMKKLIIVRSRTDNVSEVAYFISRFTGFKQGGRQ
jgi:hypothetical protein